MAHYALLDENNIVINIITGWDEGQLIDGIEPEIWYGSFHKLKCKRTSYNTYSGKHVLGGIPFRKNYAQQGYFYDEEKDAFIPPKPFNSWILNEETCNWDPPVPYPDIDEESSEQYLWNEDILNWEEIQVSE